MIKAAFHSVGNLAKLAAAMAFLTGVSLFLIATWLCTYPVLRLSPKERRIRASADFAAAGLALLTAFAPPPNQDVEPSEPFQVHHWQRTGEPPEGA